MKVLLTFISFIFFAGFVLSHLLPRLIRFWLKRVQKRFNMNAETPSGFKSRNPGSVEVNRGSQKKRIRKTAGEYVDFEEIEKA